MCICTFSSIKTVYYVIIYYNICYTTILYYYTILQYLLHASFQKGDETSDEIFSNWEIE